MLPEKRAMAIAASQINPRQMMNAYTPLENRTFTITAQDYANVSGLSVQNSYQELRKAVSAIADKSVSYKTYKAPFDFDNNKSRKPQELIVKVPWLSKAIFNDESLIISLTFNEEIIAQAVQLKGQFNSYKLQEIATLKSVYSFRLHELLNSYYTKELNTIANIELTVEQLQTSLQTPDSYGWSKISEKVLLPALKELQKLGYWEFLELETIRTGRKVTSVNIPSIKKHLGK
jgi:plasmid replication initiation protein